MKPVRVMPHISAGEVSILVEQGPVRIQIDLEPDEARELAYALAKKVLHMIEVQEKIKELEKHD